MLPYYREDCAKKKGAYNMKIDYNLLPSTVPHPHLLTGNPVCNPTYDVKLFLQPDIQKHATIHKNYQSKHHLL